MSLPRYPRYKDSGVQFLGEVPEHWTVEPLKRQLELNEGGVWGDDPDGINDTVVLRSTEQTADGRWHIEEPATRRLAASDVSAAMLVEGDLLLTKSSGSSRHIGKTTLVTSEVAALRCCYSNFMQRLRTRHTLQPSIAWYILNSDLTRRQLELLSNSSTGLANLNAEVIGLVWIAVPPLEEQKSVIGFLDRETAKIDALEAAQVRLIELLNEKRQALISHAVTKGLNPAAPMSDSGTGPLGSLPKHWGIGSLKRFMSVTDCKHVTAEFYHEGVPVASIGEVQGRWIELKNAKLTNEHFYEILVGGGRQPVAGDLIFSRNATVGEVAEVPPAHPRFAVGQDVVILRNNDSLASSGYYWFVLRSLAVRQQIQLAMIGSTFSRINVEEIRLLELPCPDFDEQKEIAMYLDAEAARFDALVSEAQRAIELLQERRSALITAAVTGQIDVRSLPEARST